MTTTAAQEMYLQDWHRLERASGAIIPTKVQTRVEGEWEAMPDPERGSVVGGFLAFAKRRALEIAAEALAAKAGPGNGDAPAPTPSPVEAPPKPAARALDALEEKSVEELIALARRAGEVAAQKQRDELLPQIESRLEVLGAEIRNRERERETLQAAVEQLGRGEYVDPAGLPVKAPRAARATEAPPTEASAPRRRTNTNARGLRDDQVLEVRRLLAEGKLSYAAIAREVECGQTTVYGIRDGKLYADVKDEETDPRS